MVQINLGHRFRFVQWTDESGNRFDQAKVTVLLDRPVKRMLAEYKEEFLVSAFTPFSKVKIKAQSIQDGWVAAGDTATVTIQEKDVVHSNPFKAAIGVRVYFIGWYGDISSTSQSVQFTVDGPKSLTANWSWYLDPFQFAATVVLAAIVILIILGITGRLKTSKQ